MGIPCGMTMSATWMEEVCGAQFEHERISQPPLE